SQQMLIFDELTSLFKALPVDENPFDQGPGAGGQRMVMRVMMQDEIFLDRDADMVTQLREFMGKK
ncbi:MAG: GLPGLI family protein, partial [Cyclobacteriaceae bacterium]|nr:GLPGLI family protein [Cyclobacteriaceae bacterium]